MNQSKDAILAAAQRFDPSSKFQQRLGWATLISSYLREGESPEAGIFALRGRTIGFLWATNMRLVYAGRNEGLILKRQVFVDQPYAAIASIRVTTKHSGLATITVDTGSDQTEFMATPATARVDDFVSLVQEKISMARDASSGVPSNDLTTQLERLSQLRKEGMLTEEEFKAAKAKLLGTNPLV